MSALEHVDGLSECIGRAIQEHLAKSNIEWPFVNGLDHPVLRVEAFLEDGVAQDGSRGSRSEKIASRTVDLTGVLTPVSLRSPVANPEYRSSVVSQSNDDGSKSTRAAQELEYRQDPAVPEDIRSDADHSVGGASSEAESDGLQRKGVGGLRISQTQTIQEDPSEHQRRIQSDNRSFPKRRKVVPEKFVFQPSTLDKLIIGIWEQIHGAINLDPQLIFEQFQIAPSATADAIQRRNGNGPSPAMEMFHSTTSRTDESFSQVNIFCRKVTQASRVCRSIEIIVQARWVEIFDEQIQYRMTMNPEQTVMKHRKAAFMKACADFGWSEKELRNKMAIWRGYKEVKDAAGWAALIFSGMGIYRFCKYRVGFDKDAMKRLQHLRPRLEVAADTLHPHWRQVLAIVGESPLLKYAGHPHDWVVFDDGSEPVPLRSTYLEYDPYFHFEHIDESVIDEGAWGCEDPRWTPQSNAVARKSDKFLCAACGEEQSDDPKLNFCYCFPMLFGCVKRGPSPIQVFRTGNGRNNGVVALHAFERGTAIGEFVGLVTKGLRHLDVMDSATSTASYQIWQGRQGNYTRFVNHSCKANAQFQPFNWLDTQRVVLVSKGIEAGMEVTVDYSDKYWGGLDKRCLCGESCCRYRRD